MDDLQLSDSEFRQFRELIYKQTGINLSEAKRQMIKTRLQKRLRHYEFENFQRYYDLVRSQGEQGEELATLINCITTNKTDFFREPHHFDYLTQKIVPELAARAKAGEIAPRLKIWHAGCSTGEESYTLGIALSEAFAKIGGGWDYRQLASDIDTEVLAKAERGVYDTERTSTISPDLLRRYFLRGAGAKSDLVQAKRELRERITFRQINFQAEKWPLQTGTQFDIIFCRNVVIYFDKPTQKRLFARFENLLRPGGWLFIGHSESLLGISDSFVSLGRTIYQLPDTAAQRKKAA